MKEIDKLRQRLRNVSRNAVEYKMSIQEAKVLVEEFTELEQKLQEIPKQYRTTSSDPIIKIHILDGGNF